jgi:hypothetical protein
VVTLHARFADGSYDSATVTVFSIDSDRNARTGWQGNYPDGSDPGLMGTEIVAATGGCYGTKASVYRYNSDSKLMSLVDSYAIVNPVAGGFDIFIPVALIRSPNFHFRAETWRESAPCAYPGISDAAPDLGAKPGSSAAVSGALAAPEISSTDAIASQTPTRLSWNAVSGAQSYLVAVDQTSNNGFASERTGQLQSLLLTTDSSATITFDGQAPARWRVWAIDSNGQAGAPSAWQ